MDKKVLVAMSGGVDSSVAAFLLKKNSYTVTGVTMCVGIKNNDGKARCCGQQAIEDAQGVCRRLDIPHYTMDFSKDLEKRVIAKFVSEYSRGRTPNPCVECNRFLKFEILLKKALGMGFDFLATGHYARIEEDGGNFILKRAKDTLKDQSYFLYPIKKEALKSILFPLAKLTKEEVRGIAREKDLAVANKPQSQDICFITNGNYRDFIFQRMGGIMPGDIVDVGGSIRGTHKGIFHYTVGQRKGLGIGNKYPFYVLSKDMDKNRVCIGPKEDLQAAGLIAGAFNLLVDNLPLEAFAKIRYAHRETKCGIFCRDNWVKIIFKEKQEAITPGQSVVLYDNDIVLGGGVIEEVLW